MMLVTIDCHYLQSKSLDSKLFILSKPITSSVDLFRVSEYRLSRDWPVSHERHDCINVATHKCYKVIVLPCVDK